MSVIVLLIAAGGVVAGGFLAAFVWAVRSGQFDDTTTPAVRVLLETHAVQMEPRTFTSGDTPLATGAEAPGQASPDPASAFKGAQ